MCRNQCFWNHMKPTPAAIFFYAAGHAYSICKYGSVSYIIDVIYCNTMNDKPQEAPKNYPVMKKLHNIIIHVKKVLGIKFRPKTTVL